MAVAPVQQGIQPLETNFLAKTVELWNSTATSPDPCVQTTAKVYYRALAVITFFLEIMKAALFVILNSGIWLANQANDYLDKKPGRSNPPPPPVPQVVPAEAAAAVPADLAAAAPPPAAAPAPLEAPAEPPPAAAPLPDEPAAPLEDEDDAPPPQELAAEAVDPMIEAADPTPAAFQGPGFLNLWLRVGTLFNDYVWQSGRDLVVASARIGNKYVVQSVKTRLAPEAVEPAALAVPEAVDQRSFIDLWSRTGALVGDYGWYIGGAISGGTLVVGNRWIWKPAAAYLMYKGLNAVMPAPADDAPPRNFQDAWNRTGSLIDDYGWQVAKQSLAYIAYGGKQYIWNPLLNSYWRAPTNVVRALPAPPFLPTQSFQDLRTRVGSLFKDYAAEPLKPAYERITKSTALQRTRDHAASQANRIRKWAFTNLNGWIVRPTVRFLQGLSGTLEHYGE